MITATREWRDGVLWCAGLFEGEGYCGIQKNRWPSIRMSLQMTDEDVVRRFHETVGRGVVNGPYQKHPDRKPQWCWSTSGYENVQALAAMWWQWLGARRRGQVGKALVEQRDRHLANKRTTCPRGHEYTHVNNRGARVCRTCQQATARRYRERRQTAARTAVETI